MSSEVQAKWIIPGGTLIPVAAIFSVRKYSIALTSWLVVRSSSLTRRASASVKSAYNARSRGNAPWSSVNSLSAGFSASASSHSISTRTR